MNSKGLKVVMALALTTAVLAIALFIWLLLSTRLFNAYAPKHWVGGLMFIPLVALLIANSIIIHKEKQGTEDSEEKKSCLETLGIVNDRCFSGQSGEVRLTVLGFLAAATVLLWMLIKLFQEKGGWPAAEKFSRSGGSSAGPMRITDNKVPWGFTATFLGLNVIFNVILFFVI